MYVFHGSSKPLVKFIFDKGSKLTDNFYYFVLGKKDIKRYHEAEHGGSEATDSEGGKLTYWRESN
jgi:hypothetical protein